MDIKEVTILLETVLHESSKAAQQTEERWAKAFDDQAKLRREELEAQIKMEQLRTEAKRLETQARTEQIRETAKLLAPLVMSAGMSVSDYFKKKGGEPTLSSPPATSPSSESSTPLPSSEGWRVSTDVLDEWSQFVVLAFPQLKPNTKALFRAFLAARLSTASLNGPPTLESKPLLDAMRADLGDEAMLVFMRMTDAAWTQEGPVATPAPAPNAVN